MESLPEPTQDEAIDALLLRSKRRGQRVPVRKGFVQRRTRRSSHPGPLAGIVSRGDERALDLYLLVITVCSSPPFDTTLPAAAWARLLGISGAHSAGAVSKVWRRLEDDGLITRERRGRRTKVILCREDATGASYTNPDGKTLRNRYLSLPFEYYSSNDRWFRRLQLHEKALLLIALSLDNSFILPQHLAPAWYGISKETAGRGLRGLEGRGLIEFEAKHVREPLSDTGWREERRYTLRPPFGPRPPATSKEADDDKETRS